MTSHQCRTAFRQVLKLAPKNGAANAFLGLCEFGLKDYDCLLQHLLRSRFSASATSPSSAARRVITRRCS